MDTPSAQPATPHARKSELDKFRLFYELDVPTREVRARIKRQSNNS